MVLYCAISGPTRELSDLSEVILATVVVGAAVGVVDPPPLKWGVYCRPRRTDNGLGDLFFVVN